MVSLFYGFMTALAQDLPQFEVAQLAQQSNGVIYADDGKTVLGVLRSDQYRVLVHWNEIAPVMRNADRLDRGPALLPARRDRPRRAWRARPSSTSGRARSPRAARRSPSSSSRTAGSPRRPASARCGARSSSRRWPTRSSSTGRSRRSSTEYLNTIYFGHQAYGVEAAAEVYFGVHAKDLQPQQAALLAALVQNPTAYDPLSAPARRALERRNLVLGKLLEQGYIDAFEYQLADSKPLLPARAARSASRPRRRRSRTTSSTTCASS